MNEYKEVRIYERLSTLHKTLVTLCVILIVMLIVVIAGVLLILGNQAQILIMQTDTLDQIMLMQLDAEMDRLEPDPWDEWNKDVIQEPAGSVSVHSLSPEERDLVERVVAAEARGEDLQGQMAVAQVVRDRSTAWDMSIGDVIFAPGQFALPYDGEISDETHLAVANVFDGHMSVLEVPTTHFHEDSVTPYWTEGKESRGSIGCHKFWY